MNIKLSFFLVFFLATTIGTVTAQQAPPVSPALQSTQHPAAPSIGTAGGRLPDENTLVIGDQSAPQQLKPVKSVGVWDFIQMLLILGIIVAAIYLLFSFLRKAGNRKLPDNNLIDVLSTRSLQQNRSLHLIEVGKQIYLVGASEGGVRLVARIDDKEAVDEIHVRAAEAGPYVGKRGNFREVFSGMFARSGPAPFGGSIAESLGFMKRQRDRLKKL